MKKITLLIALLCMAITSQAQVLLDEGFTGSSFPNPQAASGTATDAGWTALNGAIFGNCTRTTAAGGLTYPATGTKYVNSGTGNTLNNAYIGISGGASVLTKQFNASTITSGFVYLSFLYNATASGSNAQVLGLASTTVGNPVSIVSGNISSGSTYKLGVSRGSTTGANMVWNNATLNYGTTYLLVLKFTLAGDVATLYVNPTIGGTESAETPWVIDNSSNTIVSDVQYIMQRGSASNKSSYYTSGLRVSTTWAAAVAAATSSNTKIDAPITITAAASITSNGFTAAWSTVAAANGYQVNVYDGSNNLIVSQVASGQSTSSLAVTGLSGNTAYTYKVIALTPSPNTTANSAESVSSASFTTLSTGAPVLGVISNAFTATTTTNNISPVSASCLGYVADWGGSNVTARGLCWSTSTGPTTGSSKTTETPTGRGTGLFNHSLYGLTPGTIYYVRAYATNANGTTYSQELSFTTAAATCYYSQGNLNANLTASWKTTRDASGTAPGDLLQAAYYVVQNGHTMTTSGTATFGQGATSALLIENGGTINSTFAITMATSTTFQIDNGGTFNENWAAAQTNTIFQGAEVFAPASNYTLSVAPTGTTAPSAPGFGNLTINTAANGTAVGMSNNMNQIQGNLYVGPTGTGATISYRFVGSSGTGLASIGGNFTISGTNATIFLSSGSVAPTINIGGDMVIGSGGKLDYITGASSAVGILNVGGNFNNSGTFLSTTSTHATLKYATVNFFGIGKTFTQTGTYTSTNINYGVAKGSSVTLANDLNIAASRTLTVDGSLATGVTLNNAGTASINGTFQINQGGYANGTFTWAATGSTLVYNNSTGPYGSISGHTYWPTGASNQPYNVSLTGAGGVDMGSTAHTIGGVVTLNSGLTNSGSLTVNGTLQLNTGGYVGNAPIYGGSSTLIYNTGATFGRGSELNTSTPSNIQVSNKTVLNYPNGANVARTITGNLIVDAGSALYMDYGSPSMSNPLTVGGNVALNGNVSLGDGVGGDLVVAGNWSKGPSCTFAPNSRAVKFNHASANQTITGGGTFAYLTLDKAAGSLTLVDSAVVVNNTLFMTNGKFVLGGANLTIGSTGSISGASATNYIVTNGAGTLKQSVSAATASLFPIGISTSSYDPATVTPTTGTTISASVSGTLAYHNLSVPISVYLNPREWTITPTAASSTVLALTSSTLNSLVGSYNAMSGGSQGYDAINNNYYFSSATKSGNTFTTTYSDFTNPFVTATTDVAVSAKEITAKSGIYAANGQIFVENAAGKVINVYSIAGSKVRCLKNNTEKAIIPIEKGIYIISVDNVKSKVLVK